MIVIDLGLMISTMYFYPAIKSAVNTDIWRRLIKDLIELKDSELSYTKLEKRKNFIEILRKSSEGLKLSKEDFQV